jgi:ATP-dependent Clp protease ATP-binding subunit ClpA
MELQDNLKKVVYGQDEAIASLTAAIKRIRAGLGSPDRPIGSFLLLGPTGVGKTEVSKQLASVLGVNFIRFDMSEYMEKHTVAPDRRPSGYVGFDREAFDRCYTEHPCVPSERSKKHIRTSSTSCFR